MVDSAFRGLFVINIPASRRRALWPAPVMGGLAGALGFTLFIVLIWVESDGDNWFKLAGSLLVLAAGATLASSLALLASPGRLLLLLPIVDVLIAVLAAVGAEIVTVCDTCGLAFTVDVRAERGTISVP